MDSTIQKHLVISAVNIRKGGTLTVLRDCLGYLSSCREYKVTALVHSRGLCDFPGISKSRGASKAGAAGYGGNMSPWPEYRVGWGRSISGCRFMIRPLASMQPEGPYTATHLSLS